MSEQSIDALLAAFQQACVHVNFANDINQATKERAILHNELRAKLIDMGRAKHCVDTLLVACGQAQRASGGKATMHVGDLMALITEFQKGTMDEGAPITGPFYDASVQ